MTRKNTPEIVEVNSQQLEELLDRATSNTLSDEDTELLRQIFDSYVQFFEIVGDKNTTITRLRKFLFGDSSEKASKLLDDEDDMQDPSRTVMAHPTPTATRTTLPPTATNHHQAMVDMARMTIRAPLRYPRLATPS